MGGLAIKQIIGREADRFDVSMYQLYKQLISSIFTHPDYYRFPVFTHPDYYRFLVEVKEKESFGDLDVLVDNHLRELVRNQAPLVFNNNGYKFQGFVSNGNVDSYAIDNKQVDFIFLPFSQLQTASSYYSYNDLGNLIGRIAHSLGLKYGHDGLSLRLDNGESFFLTGNYPLILELLGFNDRIPFLNGFNTFKEMFEEVTKSIYFNGQLYNFEELNAINRVRNKKRNTYIAFVDYLKETGLIDKKPDYHIDKEYIKLNYIYRTDQQHAYFLANLSKARSTFLKDKFNGQTVLRYLPNLQGKELGKFISFFNGEVSNNLLEKMSNSEIEEKIRKLYSVFIKGS